MLSSRDIRVVPNYIETAWNLLFWLMVSAGSLSIILGAQLLFGSRFCEPLSDAGLLRLIRDTTISVSNVPTPHPSLLKQLACIEQDGFLLSEVGNKVRRPLNPLQRIYLQAALVDLNTQAAFLLGGVVGETITSNGLLSNLLYLGRCTDRTAGAVARLLHSETHAFSEISARLQFLEESGVRRPRLEQGYRDPTGGLTLPTLPHRG